MLSKPKLMFTPVVLQVLRKLILALSILLGLTSCQITQNNISKVDTRELLLTSAEIDTVFKISNKHNDPIQIETVDEIFALNDKAKNFVSELTALNLENDEKVRRIINHIFDRADLEMLYSASANTTAAETYDTGYANCLSLTILSYAMTHYAGIESHFQKVNIPEFWTRREGTSLINGHINLRVITGKRQGINRVQQISVIVDFDTQIRRRGFSSTDVDKARIAAMFYNNNAAELLLQNDHYNAYRYLSEAVTVDPNFSDAWVNLGLLFRRIGKYQLTQSAYTLAAQLDPDNLTAFENLAYLYEHQALNDKAEAVRSQLRFRRENNPFYHMMLGDIALDDNQLEKSIKHFQRAISIDRDQHLFYFGLARAHFASGDKKLAKRYLKRAKRNSLDDELSDLYATKLRAINLGTH